MTPEEKYQARYQRIQYGLKHRYSGNKILADLRERGLGMQRQAFQVLVKDVISGVKRRIVYSPSRFEKTQDYRFQGHVLDRWRREVFADIKIRVGYWSPSTQHKVVVKTFKYITVFLGNWTRYQWMQLTAKSIYAVIQDRLEIYSPGIQSNEWSLVGIWASKKRAAKWTKRG